MSTAPKYNLDKIKFATDTQTFERAVALYEEGKVANFKGELNGFFATVLGIKPYRVYVGAKHYDQGDCECYLGQNGTLCKHMVAVAICAVLDGKKLNQEEKRPSGALVPSGELGELTKDELTLAKKDITLAMKYVKSYTGPSRMWFAYQNSLQEGCNRLSEIVSGLPVGEQTARLLVDMLLRLDERLCRGGVDDSDGTVGVFIEEVVQVLKEYAKLDHACVNVFRDLENKETCFGWEKTLIDLIV